MIFVEKLNQATNIGQGKEAILDLRLGGTYRALNLQFKKEGSAVNEAWLRDKVVSITLEATHRVQGVKKIINAISGDDWQTLLKYNKRNVKAGLLNIPFDRPHQQRIEAQDLTVLGTGDLTNLILKIKLAGDAGANITLEGTAELVPGDSRAMGNVMYYDLVTHGPVQTGKTTVTSLPKGINQGVLAGMLVKDEGKIFDFNIKKNNISAFEVNSRLVAEQTTERFGYREVQADHFPVEFEGMLSRAADGLVLTDAYALTIEMESTDPISSLAFIRTRIGNENTAS